MRYVFLLLLLAFTLAVHAEETVTYRAAWDEGDQGLANWKTGALEKTLVDPKLGPTVIINPGGLTSPPIGVKGGRRIRFRFTYRKSHPGMLYFSAKQYAGERLLPGKNGSTVELGMDGAPHPDPTATELGMVTDAETTQIEFSFGLQGGPEQRMTVSSFTVADLGEVSAIKVEDKELLEDPGWEKRLSREKLPQENSYGLGTWMGWGLPSPMVITHNPDRVHSGKQALMFTTTGDVSTMHSGFRSNFGIQTKPDAYYDFSAWVKGEGTVQLWFVGDFCTPAIMLSPTEWRQVHLVYCADNPARKGFSTGFTVNGRVFIDDLSIRQVSAEAAAEFRKANAKWEVPPKVEQTVPEEEARYADPVTIENAHLIVVLSPQGGGRVTTLVDKDRGVEWAEQSLLQFDFPGQPVPIVCGIPFQSKRAENGREVVFSHQYTGGDAAPFLDGVLVEQIFQLAPEDRLLRVTYRLTNKSAGIRLPNPSVRCRFGDNAGWRLAAEGDEGAVLVVKKAGIIRNLVGGWMAGSSPEGSIVCGFDVRAVQEGILNADERTAVWNYLRVILPPGKSWETRAWVATVPLAEVSYADAEVVVQAGLKKVEKDYEFTLGVVPLTVTAPKVVARVTDYGGKPIVTANASHATVRFSPPGGRFVTALDIAGGGRTRTVELFNDPRAREQKDAGIQGAGETQYRPTVPIRVLRLPEVGDLRAIIAKSRAVLWDKGLFYQYVPLEPALGKLKLELESVDYQEGGFPEELEEYLPFRLVILSNLGAVHLSPMARATLSQYVRAGGSLLVTGGSLSLGNALSAGTDLEELLPATLSGAFDVQPCSGSQKLLAPVKGSFVESLPWKDAPRIYWRHNVKARPNATVHVTAGPEPVLLEWPCGHGKVMLFAGTVEGDPPAGELAAWDWKGWPQLWEKVVQHLM